MRDCPKNSPVNKKLENGLKIGTCFHGVFVIKKSTQFYLTSVAELLNQFQQRTQKNHL